MFNTFVCIYYVENLLTEIKYLQKNFVYYILESQCFSMRIFIFVYQGEKNIILYSNDNYNAEIL